MSLPLRAAVDLEDAVVQAPVEIGVAVVERGVDRGADRRQRGVGGSDEFGVGGHESRVIRFPGDVTSIPPGAVLVARARERELRHQGPLVLPPADARRRSRRRPRDTAAVPEPASPPPPISPRSRGSRERGRPCDTEARSEGDPVSAFAYRDGELHAEGVPLSGDRREVRHALLRVLAGGARSRVSATTTRRSPVSNTSSATRSRRTRTSRSWTFSRALAADSTSSPAASSRASSRRAAIPRKIVFSGVGKTEAEMAQALDAGILCFNVESEGELARLDAVAGRAGKRAPVSFRVNPDVDPKTHPYIATGLKESKFGVAFDDARDLYRAGGAHAATSPCTGSTCHIGSQITELEPYRQAAGKVLDLVDALRGRRHRAGARRPGRRPRHPLPRRASGAPVGVRGDGARASSPAARERLLFEPGRRLVGNAGVLLTRVEFLKPGDVEKLRDRRRRDERSAASRPLRRVASGRRRAAAPRPTFWSGKSSGPICESGDFLAHDRHLALAPGDLLAIGAAGAYGHVDELELQLATARLRGDCRRQTDASRAPTRGGRRPLRARVAAALKARRNA